MGIGGGYEVEVWTSARAGDLQRLVDVSLPGERLTPDELATVVWGDPGVVVGTADGLGAAAGVVRRYGSLAVGHVRLVVVDPSGRRQGRGRALLEAVEAWFRQQEVTVAVWGGEAPTYLWPGVDARWLGAQCLAEAGSYAVSGSEVNMALPSSFRAPVPDGIERRRVTTDDDVASVRGFVATHWPTWSVEVDAAIEAASIHAAFVDDEPVGFCCHSVWRIGWLGPMGTVRTRRGIGVGAALVSSVAKDLQVAGRSEVEIAWVGPLRFYAKLGADIGRVFRTYQKTLG